MGHVSAASTILINAEPAAVLSAVGDYQKSGPRSCRRTTTTTRCSKAGRARERSPAGSCRPPSRASATCKRQRRRRRPRRHREGRQLDHGHQLDGGSRGTGFQRHRHHHVDGCRRREGFLREDVRAAGTEEDSGRGAGQPEEGSRELTAQCAAAWPPRNAAMPLTTASAYFCRPSGLSISAESTGFFMLPHSTRTDGYCARFSPARSERP